MIALPHITLSKSSPCLSGALCPQVDAMLKILQGQEEAISQHAKSWSQAVVARMMFGRQEAVLGVADLASYTDDALNTHQSDPEEAVVVDLMRLDVQGAVQNFFTELHDWWSAAHLADGTCVCVCVCVCVRVRVHLGIRAEG